MSRKRLGGTDPSRARDARTTAEATARGKRKSALGSGPPIAQVAASVSESIGAEVSHLKRENKALTEKGRALDTAVAEGRLVVSLDLKEIDPLVLARDRRQLQKDGEDWAALKASIASRGQQVPIEVTKNSSDDDPGYELVSGLRRWSVLEELYRETGEDRFSRVLAFVRSMDETVPKMVAMIEENEVRQDVSFFERGRVCSVAATKGFFDSVDDAISVLFESSNRNRRYKIRCFATIYDEIGSLLDYPEELGERVGIALAKAIREGRADDLKKALENRDARYEDSGQELAVLNDFLSNRGQFAAAPSKLDPRSSADAVSANWDGGGGARIEAKASGGKVTLTLKGMAGVDSEELEGLVTFLASKRQLEK